MARGRAFRKRDPKPSLGRIRKAWGLCIAMLSVLSGPPPAKASEVLYVSTSKNDVLVITNVPWNCQNSDPVLVKIGRRPDFAHRRSKVCTSPDLERIVIEAGSRYGLDPDLISAIIQAESGLEPNAVSPKGAMGLMQLMPETAAELEISNPFDPRANINAGARYMKRLLDRFGNNATLAIAAYNAGPEAVERHAGVPPFSETRSYVQKVIEIWRGLK